MNWKQFRRMVIGLPFVVGAAVVVLILNEVGYMYNQKSSQALEGALHARDSVLLLENKLLLAETGLRGYLLTQDDKYLAAYQEGMTYAAQAITDLHEKDARHPEVMQDFIALAQALGRKSVEMDLIFRLSRESEVSTAQMLNYTGLGTQELERTHALVARIAQHTQARAEQASQSIGHIKKFSRWGIVALVLLGLVAFYKYLRQGIRLESLHQRDQQMLFDERSRLENLVRERTASLTELANHLQQVREDEREHLARELHDELGALLTAAKLDVARLKSRIDMEQPEIAERVKHLVQTLNNGIALKRRIIEDLRPSSLSNLGLATALEILTSEFAQRSNIVMERNLEQVKMTDSTELTIYRLVQESLTNIGKYAEAQHIIVSLHDYPTYAAVQIQDDGVGFDTSVVRSSAHGLAGMKHRVEAAGGKLTINSTPGSGTTVSAVIPKLPEPEVAQPTAAPQPVEVWPS